MRSITTRRIAPLAVLALAACAAAPVRESSRPTSFSYAPARFAPGEGRPQDRSPVDAAAFVERLRLADLLAHAAVHNPDLRAALEDTAAAAERRAQVTSLPDPMLRFGWFAEPIQTRTGTQEHTLMLEQAIPWPGKLAVRGEMADLGRDRARIEEWRTGRDVAIDIVVTFHELGYLHEALAIADEVEALAGRLVQLAGAERDRRATGLPEQVRAETFLAQVGYDRVALAELLETEEEHLLSVLALPAAVPLGPPEDVVLPALSLDLDRLMEIALESSPDIAAADVEIELARSRLDAARLERYPDLRLAARYIDVDGFGSGIPDDGEDPFALELGVTLPVWGSSKRAEASEARHAVRAAIARHESVARNLRSDLARAYWRAANAERLVTLHRESLVPQAERAARAAEGLFDAGETSFAGLVETLVAWQHFRLAARRAEADYAQSLARIEQLVGRPIHADLAGARAENEGGER